MNNSKIIIYTSEFPPLYGGIGNHAYNLANFFEKEAIEVEVFTHHRGILGLEELEFDSKLKFKVRRNTQYRIGFFTYFFRLIKIISYLRIKPSLRIIASGKFPIYLIGFLAIFYKKNRYFAVVHGSEINAGGFWGRLIMKRAIRNFHKVISVSNFTNNLLLKFNPKINSIVINNGYTMKIGNTKTVESKFSCFPNIVTVGSMSKRKGQHNIINALPKLIEKYPTLHYHIIGMPLELEMLERMAIQLNVINSITFHGAISDASVNQIFDISDVFVMLSENLANGEVEGFGIAILEANSCGIPAIGSEKNGIADAIDDFNTGRLIDPHDGTQFLNAMIDILQDYERYSKNAKEWTKNFHWEVIGQKYLTEMKNK